MTQRLRRLAVLQAILVAGIACSSLSCAHKPVSNAPDALQMRLVQACRDGNIADAKRCLENGAKINGDQDTSNRPLFVAVRNNHTALALLLLERGADPELRDPYGTNTLMFACWKGEYAVAARCLADGVDPDILNKTGEAPLLFAASFCYPNIVQLLLDTGADPSTMDAEGLTALHWAAFRGCSDALPILLNGAPDLLNQTDRFGRTPLIMAAISGETDVVRRLLDLGADPDIEDQSGKTALTWARENDSRDIVAILPTRNEAEVDFTNPLPDLPEGGKTRWIIRDPEEIVRYMAFNPATISDRLPASLRFITVSELAEDGIEWAIEHLQEFPSHTDWGIGFFELLRAGRFEIDGHALALKQGEAIALWCARVALVDDKQTGVKGRPYLMLDFWVPDPAYANYMRTKGHFAEAGDVHLKQTEDGWWKGTVDTHTLHLSCRCKPVGNVRYLGGGGTQTFFAPANSGIDHIIIVSFAGHKERLCQPDPQWTVTGTHPLTSGMFLGETGLQFGYDFIGSAYRK